MSALSVGYGCSIKPARGTRNFNLKFWFVWQPAQIHIHVQMRLAGTSLCQRCLLLDEIPSAPNSLYYASVLRRTVQTSCQTLERLFLSQKEKNCLVTAEFCVRNQTPLFDGKIFLSNALLIFLTNRMVESDGTANSHPYNIAYKLASGILTGYSGQDVFV